MYLYRAAFWVLMIPIAIKMGWQDSVFLVFLYSSYANFVGDFGAWEARKTRKEQQASTNDTT